MQKFIQPDLSFEDVLSVQILSFALLKAAASGKVDLNELAKHELANRGVDCNGEWVGFDKAKELHGIS